MANKFSRADWFGGRYKRARDGTYREAHTGKIFSSATSNKPIRTEPRYGHFYSGDTFASRARKNDLVFNEKKKKLVKRVLP